MRILLDECVPRPFRKELPGHDVRTVAEMGWSGRKNGVLLTLLVAEGFEVFVTTDQNLKYQRDLAAYNIAVLVLVAKSNRMADLAPLGPAARVAVQDIHPGQIVEVT